MNKKEAIGRLKRIYCENTHSTKFDTDNLRPVSGKEVCQRALDDNKAIYLAIQSLENSVTKELDYPCDLCKTREATISGRKASGEDYQLCNHCKDFIDRIYLQNEVENKPIKPASFMDFECFVNNGYYYKIAFAMPLGRLIEIEIAKDDQGDLICNITTWYEATAERLDRVQPYCIDCNERNYNLILQWIEEQRKRILTELQIWGCQK